MATSNGAVHYRVITPRPLLDRLRLWVEEATNLGLRGAFLDALRTLNKQLELHPLQWGDELKNYAQIDATEFRGMIPQWLLVWYGVSPPTHVVVVRDILPAPGSPLSQPS